MDIWYCVGIGNAYLIFTVFINFYRRKEKILVLFLVFCMNIIPFVRWVKFEWVWFFSFFPMSDQCRVTVICKQLNIFKHSLYTVSSLRGVKGNNNAMMLLHVHLKVCRISISNHFGWTRFNSKHFCSYFLSKFKILFTYVCSLEVMLKNEPPSMLGRP